MIVRPSTEQVLLDCARELLEQVLPAMRDETGQVRVVMLEQVLRNAAMRSAHEIAWMREDTPVLLAYARDVSLATGDAAVAAALVAAEAATTASLHLDDTTAMYVAASEALSSALEAATAHGDTELAAAGVAVLEARVARERAVMCGWGDVAGR